MARANELMRPYGEFGNGGYGDGRWRGGVHEDDASDGVDGPSVSMCYAYSGRGRFCAGKVSGRNRGACVNLEAERKDEAVSVGEFCGADRFFDLVGGDVSASRAWSCETARVAWRRDVFGENDRKG